jgi:hypothetical protein
MGKHLKMCPTFIEEVWALIKTVKIQSPRGGLRVRAKAGLRDVHAWRFYSSRAIKV